MTTLCLLFGTKKWLLETVMKIMILDKCKKMAPLILREATFGLACLPFGFWCQTYLIWILGPKLLLSNN